jgi:threonine aldolase
MWRAMRDDGCAWSRLGDPTVRALEERAAALTGTEDAVFAPTGTMANTLALLALTRPGDTFIVDRRAHVVVSEDRSFARFGGLYPEMLDGKEGRMLPDEVEAAFATRHLGAARRTPLVWIENTHTAAGGTVTGLETTDRIAALARDHSAALHIDGARLFSAAAALGVCLERLVPSGASVTLNLNKGLCAPAGALLCGPAPLAAEARDRLLGMGGVLAQAGPFAAAGLVALEEDGIAALSADNQRARDLAEALVGLDGCSVGMPETNIVLVVLPPPSTAARMRSALEVEGVLALAYPPRTIRLVTHRQLDEDCPARVVSAFARALARSFEEK